MHMKTIFLLIFLFLRNLTGSLGLQCYSCLNDNGNSCGDPFNSQGSGIIKVNSTSGYCWKAKIDMGDLKAVARDGGTVENALELSCSNTNVCQRVTIGNLRPILCCCHDKDLCNTASMYSSKFCIFNVVIAILVYAYIN